MNNIKEQFNIINIYNNENKSEEELKLIFNKKLLNLIYKLEKNSFFKCINEENMI